MARQEVNTQPVAGPDTATATPTGGSSRRRLTVGVAVLAALAYIPTLLSAPDRMPADTKLGSTSTRSGSSAMHRGRSTPGSSPAGAPPDDRLRLAERPVVRGRRRHRPARLDRPPSMARHAARACRLRRAVLRPPPWHLARRCARRRLLYQLSPYVVPYVSRTSSMLLPWVGLGWIVGLTVGAALRSVGDAALCALVVGTVGRQRDGVGDDRSGTGDLAGRRGDRAASGCAGRSPRRCASARCRCSPQRGG